MSPIDEQRIQAAYEKAKADRRYESVARNDGKTERAYALTDAKEYFAEATEAYFSTNDFFPYNRDDLRGHDRTIYDVLEEVWNR